MKLIAGYVERNQNLDKSDPDPAPPVIASLRSLVDPNYRVADWMLALRPTVDKGYCIPDPLTWQRVSDIVGIEFQKYLNEDITAEEALGRARRQVEELYR